MDWLDKIKKPKRLVPAMVVGTPSDLRSQLVDYLMLHGFEPEVCDGHTQAASKLNALKRTNNLPAFIISGYQGAGAGNAATFLQGKANQDVPLVGVTNDQADINKAGSPDQHDALWQLGATYCIEQKDLKDIIKPNTNCDPVSVNFLEKLEEYRESWLAKNPFRDLP